MSKNFAFIGFAAVALLLAQGHEAKAQGGGSVIDGANLMAPSSGTTYHANTSGHAYVGVESQSTSGELVGHGVIFKGPMAGKVSWLVGIQAYFGDPRSSDPSTSTTQDATLFTGVSSWGGSGTVNLVDPNDKLIKTDGCYGTFDFYKPNYKGTQSATATATLSWTAPRATGSKRGHRTFFIDFPGSSLE